MDYLLHQKNKYARISRENSRFSDLRLDIAKRNPGKQGLRVIGKLTCESSFIFNTALQVSPSPNYVIWDMRHLVERYQPWLDFVFDETITAQEFIFEFASIVSDLDINESLYNFVYARYPYAVDYNLNQVQLLIETVIEDYYTQLQQAMVSYGLPEYLEFVLIKFIDPYSAVLQISAT